MRCPSCPCSTAPQLKWKVPLSRKVAAACACICALLPRCIGSATCRLSLQLPCAALPPQYGSSAFLCKRRLQPLSSATPV